MWIDSWYDRHIRAWCIQIKDKEGNQIEEAIHVYSKDDKNKEIKRLKEKYSNCDK